MYNFIQRRVVERTTGPQPVFTTIVDQTVRTWIPATALLLATFVTPARAKLDVRSYDWAPQSGWMQTAVNPAIRTWAPIFSSELASFCTADRPAVNVRTDWAPAFTWVGPVADATVRTWTPVFSTELASFRTSERPTPDVRAGSTATDISWIVTIQNSPPTAAQRWPALLQNLGTHFRTGAPPALDIRTYDWAPQQTGWIVANLTQAATTAQIAPALLQNSGTNFRTAARPPLDVRTYEWAPEFVSPIRLVDAVVATWTPIFSAQASCAFTPSRPGLDQRWLDWTPEPAWILSGIAPPATTAQTWPAVLSNLPLSYRTAARRALDVRDVDWSPQFGWMPTVVDGVVAKYAPVFAAEAASTRTPDRPRLDVRLVSWAPDGSAWIVGEVSPTATTAQIAPAWLQTLASFRTSDAPRLDVRRHDWLQSGWAPRVVDATVAKWAPIWQAELGYRTPDGPVLDVRSQTSAPQIGWWSGVLVLVAPPTVSTASVTSVDARMTRTVDTWLVHTIGDV